MQSVICSLQSVVCSLQSAVCSLQSANVRHRVPTDILLVNGDEPNLILPKFARPLYFFFLISF